MWGKARDRWLIKEETSKYIKLFKLTSNAKHKLKQLG